MVAPAWPPITGTEHQVRRQVKGPADEGRGADGVEDGDSEETTAAVDAFAPIDLGEERKEGIDRVCEKKDERIGAVVTACFR